MVQGDWYWNGIRPELPSKYSPLEVSGDRNPR